MACYLIKKNDKTNEIVYMEYELKGYKFKPNNKKSSLEVKEITIIKPSMIEGILELKFDRAYKRILESTYNALKDDTKPQKKIAKAIEEVEKLKSVVVDKYQSFLPQKKKEQLLSKLQLMLDSLGSKLDEENNDDEEKIEIYFKNLLSRAYITLNDENDDDANAAMVIDEIDRLRAVFARYNDKENEKHKDYLEKLEVLRKELAKKQVNIRKRQVLKEIDKMLMTNQYEDEKAKKR